MLERVSRLYETCEKNPFLNIQNNFFHEIDLNNVVPDVWTHIIINYFLSTMYIGNNQLLS